MEAQAPAVPTPLALIPNALTIARLALIPVFVVLMVRAGHDPSWPAGIVFGIAGITDQVDGFLARRWHVESRFGQIADPLADRLMIDAAVILLAYYDRLPWVGLAVIIGRDVLLLAGSRLLAPRGIEIEVNTVGKAATWVLYAAIAFRIVTHPSTQWPLYLFWAGIVLAVVAAVFYIQHGPERTAPMKAVVMAGGEGTRLRPLTSNQPKPMVPIVGKPCMEHIVELLKRHGFEDVIVTVAFLPQAIRSYFGNGESARRRHRLLGGGVAARHRRLGQARGGEARRHVPRHLRRRPLRRRPDPARRSAP